MTPNEFCYWLDFVDAADLSKVKEKRKATLDVARRTTASASAAAPLRCFTRDYIPVIPPSWELKGGPSSGLKGES